jgi:gas vesicle protein
MANSGNMFGIVLTGALIGGVVGILFYASRSKVLKQSIVNKTEGLADQLNERIEAGKSLLTELQKMTDAAKSKVTRVMTSK